MQQMMADFDQFAFIPGSFFMWSPRRKAIMYDESRMDTNSGLIALLHELGHASLGHKLYKYDCELLKMEMEAWDFVRDHAAKYGVEVDEKHIAKCIATYDKWLTKRATCPDCNNFSLQRGRDEYHCFACGTAWNVNWRKDRRVTRTVISRFEPKSINDFTPAFA